MKKRKKIDSREIGLEIGLIFAKHFLRTEHLHYGFWTDDLTIDLFNLPQAQENHSRFIIAHIPEEVKTILDVGCGVGYFTRMLIDLGYKVDCVSPSPFLTKRIRDNVGNSNTIFECSFENLKTENRYDMVLFSESFQYVNLEKALRNSHAVLRDGGYLLICDFFKTDAEGECLISGGHKLTKFYNAIQHSAFTPVLDMDVTKETAPNLKLMNDFFLNVGLPAWNLIMYFLNDATPWFSRFLRWKYRKKLSRLNKKYFSNEVNDEHFKIYKSYRFLLYRKTASVSE